MAEIPQKRDFLTYSIQNFVRKVKQFVRKYSQTCLYDHLYKMTNAESTQANSNTITCHKMTTCLMQPV